MQNTNQELDAVAALIGSAIGIAILVVLLLLTIGVAFAICYVLSRSLAAVPAEHRRMEPAMVWLLLIPCFNLVWSFFVFRRIPDSFQSYFSSIGRTDVGDCGRTVGMWTSITLLLSFIPVVQLIFLVLLIISLVRFNELKNKIVRS